MRERKAWWSQYGAPGRVGAAVASLVAVLVTLVEGAYGGTVVALAFAVVFVLSACHWARRHWEPGQ